MKSKSINKLVLLLIVSVLFPQFKEKVSSPQLPSPIHNPDKVYNSFLSQNRFNIQQGFSMNMIQMGNQSIGIGSYFNQVDILLSDKINLHMNFMLSQSNISQYYSTGNVQYGATLDYKLTNNSLIQVSFQTFPTYQKYQTLTHNPIYGR